MPIVEAGFIGIESIADPASALQVHGPTIGVTVGPGIGAEGWADIIGDRENPSLAPSAKLVPALLDTGASDSCIDQHLADELCLPLVDKGYASGVGGKTDFNVYLCSIAIPTLSVVRTGLFMAVHLGAGGQQHRVLIGRNLMTDMVIVYNGRLGSVCVCR